ncbi:MAG: hypothetical protein WC399_01355 [Bacilli bacterium]|jgi:hypothetical protein
MFVVFEAMPWWGWVLIGVGVIGLGALKLFLFDKIRARKKSQSAPSKSVDED